MPTIDHAGVFEIDCQGVRADKRQVTAYFVVPTPLPKADPRLIMNCFTPPQVPVLSALARLERVCKEGKNDQRTKSRASK